jgi:hypothetical protein
MRVMVFDTFGLAPVKSVDGSWSKVVILWPVIGATLVLVTLLNL